MTALPELVLTATRWKQAIFGTTEQTSPEEIAMQNNAVDVTISCDGI